MAVAGRNGQIRLWNVINGSLERDVTAGRRRIRTLAFSPNSARLAYAGDAATIHVVDLSGASQDVILPARPAKIHAAVFLGDHSLATGGSDNRIRVWDLASRIVTRELLGHTGTVAALACDATGDTLVSGSYDTTLRIWRVTNSHDFPTVAQSVGEGVR
jgi:WD40 repeat protein